MSKSPKGTLKKKQQEMKNILSYFFILLFVLPPLSAFCAITQGVTVSEAQNTVKKTRTIVTTDGELDDVDSFIRLLLYANEFSIEGLIISSSQ